MEDRRCAIRWGIAVPVRYVETTTYAEGSCRTQDISTVGAKLAMAKKYKTGQRFELMVELPGSGGPLCVEADVVWQNKLDELKEECNYMTGVAFRKIRDCHKKSIFDYVNTYFPQEVRSHWWDGCR